MSNPSQISVHEPAHEHFEELPSGTALCNNQYVIERYLNSGGFGVTYLARDSLGRHVVIKECFPNAICFRSGKSVHLRSTSVEDDFSRIVELFQKEARALAQLQHPNIVGVHQIFEANGTAYMALDFVAGMDLYDLMERHSNYLTPEVIQSITATLLDALVYIHENGILHRDISPDNILLDNSGSPVLIDFGASRQGALQSSRILSRVHTVKDGYSPHEFYFDGHAQSQCSDLYALAATIVHLVTGAPPPNSYARLAAISENKPDPYQPLAGRFPAYDAAFLQCVDVTMNLFAKDRIQTAADWLGALNGASNKRLPDSLPLDMDPEIDRIIADMVKSNHAALVEDAAKQKAEPEDVEGPDDIEAARIAAEREYWSILNEDPRDFVQPEEPMPQPKPATPLAKSSFSVRGILGWAVRRPAGAARNSK